MARVVLAIAAVAPVVLALVIKQYVNAVYAAARSMPVASRVTGGEAARLLLYATGSREIGVEIISGSLNDHFDPAAGVIRITPETNSESSIAALAIVGHEVGHVAQHKIGSWLIVVRNLLLRATQIASSLGTLLMVIGIAAAVLRIGVGPFMLVAGFLSLLLSAAFAVVTLPLEFDASRRALRLLVAANVLSVDELPAVRRVLTAAALSYAASAVMAMSRVPFLLGRLGR